MEGGCPRTFCFISSHLVSRVVGEMIRIGVLSLIKGSKGYPKLGQRIIIYLIASLKNCKWVNCKGSGAQWYRFHCKYITSS